jgi:hypothetical protein
MDLVTAFLDGMRWARQHSLSADADGEHWITVNGGSKAGGEGGGSHVKLDGEGRIVAGMGGKFTGTKIDDVPRKKFIGEGAYQRRVGNYAPVPGGRSGALPRSTKKSGAEWRDPQAQNPVSAGLASVPGSPGKWRLSGNKKDRDRQMKVLFGLSLKRDDNGRIVSARLDGRAVHPVDADDVMQGMANAHYDQDKGGWENLPNVKLRGAVFPEPLTFRGWEGSDKRLSRAARAMQREMDAEAAMEERFREYAKKKKERQISVMQPIPDGEYKLKRARPVSPGDTTEAARKFSARVAESLVRKGGYERDGEVLIPEGLNRDMSELLAKKIGGSKDTWHAKIMGSHYDTNAVQFVSDDPETQRILNNYAVGLSDDIHASYKRLRNGGALQERDILRAGGKKRGDRIAIGGAANLMDRVPNDLWKKRGNTDPTFDPLTGKFSAENKELEAALNQHYGKGAGTP